MIRVKKTSRNADDFKVLVVGVFCAIIILMSSLVYPRLVEFRWYRDLMRITPFYNVELYYSSITPDGTKIVFGGTLIKRRCDFDNLVGYVTGQYGQRHRVAVDTSVEDLNGVTGSRPPSSDPEAWGPWSIDITDRTIFGFDLKPTDFEVIAFHIQCNTDPENQSNLVIEAPWENFQIELSEDEAEQLVPLKGELP